ncbi:adh short, KR, NAD binding 10, and/or Epimerase domain containing protein [Asbolus verrucosus]|uniref:Adh short, KR, NAD binding 10, and/or Epimerase domain containing protein n=1 Tax=Asbolus verrucosus TaxID=1661398 RepID=A0A482W1D2_ASBVE|nr:adh short, KR, NAD binding 10, and/or Epimerase domain containing protein [Asbolus verrucosus]
MERWSGKVAVVTGASAGIGAAISTKLVESGLQVVGLARRLDRLQELARKLQNQPGKFHPIATDVTVEEEVVRAFDWVRTNLGTLHVLVNNAGIAKPATLLDGDTEIFRKVFDTNVLALTVATREAVKIMREKDVEAAHVIHINSTAGHQVSDVPKMNVYFASKHAVTALAESLRLDLLRAGAGNKIRVTSLSPGLVETEIINDFLDNQDLVKLLEVAPKLFPEDIANAVVYALGAPPHVQVGILECNKQKVLMALFQRWVGKVAVVTGASSGIGAAIAEQLVEIGLQVTKPNSKKFFDSILQVVGVARRVDLIQQHSQRLSHKKGKLHPCQADVSKEDEIVAAFRWIGESLGPVHILVNNAGVGHATTLADGDAEKWRSVLELNVLGLCVATREAVKAMRQHGVDGHIVHINSYAGRLVPNCPGRNVYPASKRAVTALTETLRQEFNALGVSPGLFTTELTTLKKDRNPKEWTAMEELPILQPEDIADGVVYVLSTPEHVQVHELTIKLVGELF